MTIIYWKNLKTCKIKFPYLKDELIPFIDTQKCVRTHIYINTHTTHTHLLSLNFKRTCEIQSKKRAKGFQVIMSPKRSLPDSEE